MISFCIIAHNSEKTIQKCLMSILNLNYKDIEIIIVEDGSTDNTQKIIEEHNAIYNNINYVHHDKRLGRGLARQIALEEAKGEYIAFLDADGWIENKDWVEDMLKNMIPRNIAGAFSLSKAINSENSLARYWTNYVTLLNTNHYSNKTEIRNEGIGTGNILVKRECLDKTSGFNTQLEAVEDIYLFKEIIKNGYNFVFVPECRMTREQPSTMNEIWKKEMYYTYWQGKYALYYKKFIKLFLLRYMIFLMILPFVLYCTYKSVRRYIITKDIACFWAVLFKSQMAILSPFILLKSYIEK